jgi:hypothetical protein
MNADSEPGGPDQGQPTHFYPRRNPFLFRIRVPADLEKELDLDVDRERKTEKACVAQERLPDRSSGDLDGSRRRLLAACAMSCARIFRQS